MKKFLIYSILAIFPFLLAAQDAGMHKIDGSVYDENGEPLMGATIRVAHQANGTITDIDGKFSIFVPSGKKSEIISRMSVMPRRHWKSLPKRPMSKST